MRLKFVRRTRVRKKGIYHKHYTRAFLDELVHLWLKKINSFGPVHLNFFRPYFVSFSPIIHYSFVIESFYLFIIFQLFAIILSLLLIFVFASLQNQRKLFFTILSHIAPFYGGLALAKFEFNPSLRTLHSLLQKMMITYRCRSFGVNQHSIIPTQRRTCSLVVKVLLKH